MIDLSLLTSGAESVRIAVAGDCCLDAYWQLDGEERAISVETHLPVRQVSSQRYSLGGAGNVAANLVALGVSEVRVIGVYGGDPFGHVLIRLLSGLPLDLSGMIDMGPSWETMVYAKPFLNRNEQERFDFGTRSELPAESVAALVDRLAEAATWADVVVINQQVRGWVAQPAMTAAINHIIADHPETIFLVDVRDLGAHFRGAILKMNAGEAARLVGHDDGNTSSGPEVATLAEQIMRRTGRPVFVTRGERGILAIDDSGIHEALGIEIIDETDPVGAGDTVSAAVALVLARGGDIRTAAEVANLAASLTVRKTRQTGTVTTQELVHAAERCDFVYSPDLAENPAVARFLPGTEFELCGELPELPRIKHAIFDHDGTLSTLRQGWEDVMKPMMIRAVLGSRFSSVDPVTYQKVEASIRDFVDRTTGVQTLVQMQGLVGLVRRWGFVPAREVLDEHGYKAVYNEELMQVVRRRRSKLASGQLQPEDFHIKGAIPMLQLLRDQGVVLHLASGTDVADTADEAQLLGFGDFFGDRIYGAVGDVNIEAKRQVLEGLVGRGRLEGDSLVTFGDGPVEMRVTRRHGGIAVGVCSDERRRHGFNPAKRSRLIRGGAMLLIPDFSDLKTIVSVLRLDQSAYRPVATALGVSALKRGLE
jgi:rfaE bifunctional protein kinase chain/domain